MNLKRAFKDFARKIQLYPKMATTGRMEPTSRSRPSPCSTPTPSPWTTIPTSQWTRQSVPIWMKESCFYHCIALQRNFWSNIYLLSKRAISWSIFTQGYSAIFQNKRPFTEWIHQRSLLIFKPWEDTPYLSFWPLYLLLSLLCLHNSRPVLHKTRVQYSDSKYVNFPGDYSSDAKFFVFIGKFSHNF